MFDAAGLAESHLGWLQGNFFGGGPGPTEGDVCEGAHGPLEHSHFFTDDGAFGSHDEHGEQVDDGDYEPVDENTLGFPSHASEFGYDGELTVDYEITDDVVTFDVVLPDECEDTCTGRLRVGALRVRIRAMVPRRSAQLIAVRLAQPRHHRRNAPLPPDRVGDDRAVGAPFSMAGASPARSLEGRASTRVHTTDAPRPRCRGRRPLVGLTAATIADRSPSWTTSRWTLVRGSAASPSRAAQWPAPRIASEPAAGEEAAGAEQQRLGRRLAVRPARLPGRRRFATTANRSPPSDQSAARPVAHQAASARRSRLRATRRSTAAAQPLWEE